ncbi:hypothetical protein FKP32DRAFT_367027 [Trametes sanguinea]|nr:hypothetical protein FKP32DRAFT_367027 [Trametes sanguinea]
MRYRSTLDRRLAAAHTTPHGSRRTGTRAYRRRVGVANLTCASSAGRFKRAGHAHAHPKCTPRSGPHTTIVHAHPTPALARTLATPRPSFHHRIQADSDCVLERDRVMLRSRPCLGRRDDSFRRNLRVGGVLRTEEANLRVQAHGGTSIVCTCELEQGCLRYQLRQSPRWGVV